jgi:hypothetical protein
MAANCAVSSSSDEAPREITPSDMVKASTISV